MSTGDEEKRRNWGGVIWEDPGQVAAGSYQTFVLRYVAGSLGIDEQGGIRISIRDQSDHGYFQTSDPKADNYVSVQIRPDLKVKAEYTRKGNVRPYRPTLFIHIFDGPLNEGEEIKVVIGDTSGGSRGLRVQTFAEPGSHFRMEVDPFGTHDYALLPDLPSFDVVAGAPHRYQLHVPTLLVAGEPCQLRVKCEDMWGNPLRHLDMRPEIFRIAEGADGVRTAVDGSPAHDEGVLSYALPALETPGTYRYVIDDGVVDDGSILGGESNPLLVLEAGSQPPYRFFWGDFHGQTGETIGTGTVEEYFHFGRHFGFLDGSCHQGNDFQIDAAIWERIVAAGNGSYQAGEFVTFNGIEWSGNTPMGGDHNVLFNEEHPPLYRSTGWLASDGSKMEEVAPLSKLYEVLKKHDAMTIPHIGGRPAELEYTDPEVERLVELHSAWGTFEWVYKRAFAKGFKVGFVCNSDGHKARPGASYPGASTFGTLGGLTCVLAEEKTRDSFWRALKGRRCYGTTGQRILLDVTCEGQPMGSDLTVSGPFPVTGRVVGTAPLFGVDLMREAEVVETLLPPAMGEAGPRGEDTVVIRLGGSRVYGRGRIVEWSGRLWMEGNKIADARMHGLFNPEQGIRSSSGEEVGFYFISSGNSLNFCLKPTAQREGILHFESGPCSFSIPLADLTTAPRRFYEAPIDQFCEVFAAPLEGLPWQMEFNFSAPPPDQPQVPYFVRVRQLNEAKAWSSPFYVSRG
ncbi:MAG: DUF3604 domain-containing protein [SAR324 cluster bacterium]|nr:DUF3604 domain-containing protein [SAR324 cluster bacterium]